MTTNDAYQTALLDVKRRVKASGTSFSAGMRVLPPARREAMYALYAFCREVDDIADDSPTAEIRQTGLTLWHERIHNLFHNEVANDSICICLLPAIKKFDLIESDFQDIIEGMDMDARETICAPTMTYLDEYCDHVASAVGRASVRIFGDSSADAMRVAHHLGRALQLTNILRDLYEDAQRGRLYLPKELLEKHDIPVTTAIDMIGNPRLRLVCRELSLEVTRHFKEADTAINACLWQAMKPARIMRDYYGAIFDLLLKEDWKDVSKRVSLPLYIKLRLALRGLSG